MSEAVETGTNQLQNKIDSRFLEQRKIYLWGVVNDDTARHVVERLLYLEAEDPGKDITFYINSPGGAVTSGMAIFDTMRMISSDVSTVCLGLAASMGALLLCGGTKGKRYSYPHSRIMIHQPLISGQIIGPAVDISIHAKEMKKTRGEINRIISLATGKPLEIVEKDTDRDFYMNAEEAREYGLVDAVVEKL